MKFDPADVAKEAMGSPAFQQAEPDGASASAPASDGAYDPNSIPPEEAAIGQSMIAAMKKGDGGAMARSMRDFIEFCYPSLAAEKAEADAPPESPEGV